MAYTDREILKFQQKGALATAPGITNAADAVNSAHTRAYVITKYGTENAATNVSETPGFVVNRKARVKTAKFLTNTTIANVATDYDVIYLYKRTSAGASQTLLGSWNTSAAAVGGAITAHVPASLTLVDNTDLDIDAGAIVTYLIGKFGAGKLVADATITVDCEEK